MIWKLLLPGRRVLKARSSGPSMDPCRSDDRRFFFGFDTKVSQPILSQICAESRQCLLDYGHGQFIFGLEGEAGLWWGPEDVLLFDQDWCLRWATPSLEGLKGLDYVKNIALDSTQAQYIYYKYMLPVDDDSSQDASDDGSYGDQYEEDDENAADSDSEPTKPESKALQPRRMTFGYLSCAATPHFLEYFTALNKLMLVFELVVFLGGAYRRYFSAAAACGWPISHFLDDHSGVYRYVTFGRDSARIEDAVEEVSKLRWLWMKTKLLQRWLQSDQFYDDAFDDDRILYDFCVEDSLVGAAHEPTRVSSFNMMDDEEWAL